MIKTCTATLATAALLALAATTPAAASRSQTFATNNDGDFKSGATSSSVNHAMSVITTGPNGPVVTAQADSNGDAFAQLSYSFYVGLPANEYFTLGNGDSLFLPLTVTFASTATVVNGGEGASFSQGYTDLLIQNDIQSTSYEFTQDCEGDFGTCGPTGTITDPVHYLFAYNDNGQLQFGGHGYLTLTVEAKGAGAFAQLDPIIAFAPEFLAAHPDATLSVEPLDIGGGGDLGGVPEPATWALMIGGFGLAGAALRRRGRRASV